MLNLNTGVHLDKVELAVFIQELEGACAAVTDLHARLGTAFADIATHFHGNARRRRFFNHFLVTTLHRAVAFRQIDGVALTVRQHLNLDVARVFKVLLHVDHVVVESGFRFRTGHVNGVFQLFIAANDAHTAPAAAAGGFDNYRIADALGDGAVLIHIVAQRTVRTRHARHARFFHRVDCRNFVAHQANRFGTRTDENKAGTLYLLGKVGVFRQEAVAWVNRHRAGDFRCGDQRRNVQVAFN